MRLLRRSLLLLVMAALVFVPRNIFSCGPFFETATFSFPTHPDYPLSDYLHGKLGVIKPSFYRMFLFVAYRQLSGHPLNSREMSALEPLLHREAHNADMDDAFGMNDDEDQPSTPRSPSASEVWLAERAKALGEKPPSAGNPVDPYLPYGDYQNFLNCPDDGFKTAVATLHDRQGKWGADSPDVKTWIAGQDTVFARCSKRQNVLPPEITTSNTLLKKDRDYQVAAALFYGGNSDQLLQAVTHFDEIGHDKLSPWEPWAPYLAARSMIRAASLKSDQDHPFDAELMTKAEQRLQAILNDRMLAAVHPASQQMLGYVEARLRPERRTRDLAQRLANGTSNDIAQDVIDYRFLLDHGVGTDAASEARKDDVTDWIRTVQAGDAGRDHAVAKWKSSKSQPWLVAALMTADIAHPSPDELMAAAATLDAHDPKLLTVLYRRVALTRALGRDEDARALIDSNLSYLSKVPASSRNLFWAERLALAQSYNEFLRFAPREDAGRHHAQSPGTASGSPSDLYFDVDATAVMNRILPLSVLLQATESARLPKVLQSYVAQATWTRSLLLKNYQAVAKLAPSVKSATVDAGFVDAITNAKSGEDRERETLWTLLHNPGLRPFVVPNMQRDTAMKEIDHFRDNWWCADVGFAVDTAGAQYGDSLEVKVDATKKAPPDVSFLTEQQKSEGADEWKKLSSVGAAPNYLAAGVLAWAKASPDDARIPEALHLVVRAGHYGCTDDHSRVYSKQAFQLLHAKYPSSQWTKKTPYYY